MAGWQPATNNGQQATNNGQYQANPVILTDLKNFLFNQACHGILADAGDLAQGA